MYKRKYLGSVFYNNFLSWSNYKLKKKKTEYNLNYISLTAGKSDNSDVIHSTRLNFNKTTTIVILNEYPMVYDSYFSTAEETPTKIVLKLNEK